MRIRPISVIFSILLFANLIVFSQTTAFNYQGSLSDTGTPQATYQMQFRLFDAAVGGSQIGATINNSSVAVSGGVFSVLLDFGANVFTGTDRFLEIGVRRGASENYTILAPRQQIASSPYSVRTISAQTADVALDSQKLGGVNASEYVTNSNVGSSFIRNSTTTQSANFNISGNGLIGGSVGLGTSTNPNFRLESFGAIRSFSTSAAHFVAETTGGTNSWARFYARSPNRSWFMGTSQNFNNDQFYLVDETAGQTRMAISTGGFVGINNANPQTGLDLRGTGLQVQQRITDNTSNNSLVLQAGAGGNMKVTGYNYNTNSAVPLYLSTDGANTVMNSGGGNVMHPGTGYGLPKAMLFVLADGTISYCYNGVTGATTSGCGFSAERFPSNTYRIDLGFQLGPRFLSLTSSGSFNHISGRLWNNGNPLVFVDFWITGETSSQVPSDFFLIVY